MRERMEENCRERVNKMRVLSSIKCLPGNMMQEWEKNDEKMNGSKSE